MESNPFDLAEEFCKLVGVHSLLDYLGVTADTSPAEVQDRLKARRKHMQGMQSNPKYKAEALFLIRNFAALSEALTDPQVYSEDVARRNESSHLQILEMTIRGLLAGQSGGRISPQQEAYLRKNAKELRISERSYERLLRRLGVESGVELPLPPPTPSMVPESAPVGSTATVDKTSRPTAPGGGPRARSSESETAPPVRERALSPAGPVMPARLEIPGDPVRKLVLGEVNGVTIAIRNGGDLPMPGTIEADVPWLIPVQTSLDPTAASQSVEVRIAPGLVEGMTKGIVTIATENAGSAEIEIDLVRAPGRRRAIAVGGAIAVLIASGVGFGWWWETTSGTRLTVTIDPVGTLLVNGQAAGTGTTVVMEDPPLGAVQVEVTGNANFRPWKRGITVEAGDRQELEAHLELAEPIGTFPAGTASPCEDQPARRAIGERLPGLKRCVAPIDSEQKVRATVRIDQTGLPVGIDLAGPELPGPVRECVERQIGAMNLSNPAGDACLVSFEIPRQ